MTEKVLVLRACNPDGTSYNGFQWPKEGVVTAPNWDPTPVCGDGLHGWLWGEGDLASSDYWGKRDALWLVLEVFACDVVDLQGKVKFSRCEVVFAGNREDAVAYLQKRAPGRAVMFSTATAGICGTATAGNYGNATAGNAGNAIAGERGTATAGICGTATAGNAGTATVGERGTATAGICGTATAGNAGTAIAGERGTATVGAYGTATAGICGTATAGERGTAIAGERGTAIAGERGTATVGAYGIATAGVYGIATAGVYGMVTAGERGILQVHWYNSTAGRYRITTGYVGEDGIEPNVLYSFDHERQLWVVNKIIQSKG